MTTSNRGRGGRRRRRRVRDSPFRANQRIQFWLRRGFLFDEARALQSANIPISSSGGNNTLREVRRRMITRRRELLRFYHGQGLTNFQIFQILNEVRDTFSVQEEILDLSPSAIPEPRLGSRQERMRGGVHDPSSGIFQDFPITEADVIDTLEYIEREVSLTPEDRILFESWHQTQNVIPQDETIDD